MSSTLPVPAAMLSIRSGRFFAARAGERAAILAAALVILVHVWVISAGWMTYWPQYTSYFDRLSDAFAHGQCSLRSQPDPGLLALPDPYDPVANATYRHQAGVHDSLLFDGKYYLYWGPVPAILMVPFKLIIGGRAIGDQFPTFAFALGLTVFGALLMHRIWRTFFRHLPVSLLFMAILIVGLCAPIPYTLARPAVYEAAILGGQCFLIAGIYFAFPLDRTPGPRQLAAAGVSWSLALGCRVSLVFAVAALCLIVTWQTLRELAAKDAWNRILATVTPLLITAALLASYNIVRFGRWSDFGQQYQLNSANYHSTPRLFQPANAAPGLYSYLLRPIEIHLDFPFVNAIAGEGTFPRWIVRPRHYESYEPIAGILVASPIVVLALIPLGRLLIRDRPDIRQLTLALFCASALGFAPIPFMLGSTMRYLCDLMPGLLILASIGLGQEISSPLLRGRLRRLFLTATAMTAVWSIAVGVLLGITGYYGHFRQYHPHLFGNISYWTQKPTNEAG